jgi:hypothetical protein
MDKCLEQTAALRTDFAQVLENLVRIVYEEWKVVYEFWRPGLNTLNEWNFNFEENENNDYPRTLLKTLCILNGTLPKDYRSDELLKVAIDNLLTPSFERRTLAFVRERLWPKHLSTGDEEAVEESDCKVGNWGSFLEIRVIFNTLLTLATTQTTPGGARPTFESDVGKGQTVNRKIQIVYRHN